jgi:hypothetical protein
MDNINNNPTDGPISPPQRLTIKSTPPTSRRRQRRSYWPTVFAEARECRGEWVRIERWFNRSTAAQVASDLRNAHHRSAKKMRFSGIEPGDMWQACWGADPTDTEPEHFYVWMCFEGRRTTAQFEVIANW